MSASSPAVVTLKPRRALPFFSQHPWVFAGAVRSVSGMPQVGEAVIVRSHEGQFIAHGLFHPTSNIQVRLYSWKEDQPLDDAFWIARVASAVGFRQKLFHGQPAERACRLIFSEADGLSGLIVDRVNDWLVVQWTSSALAQRQALILGELQKLLQPRGIWLRTERGIKELENLEVEDGLLTGENPPRSLEIVENGLKFLVDLKAGQKTGFYFDQRDNRALMKTYATSSSRVLDLYTYTGSFALAAARLGDCRNVTAVDSSQPAIDMGIANAELNGLADRIHFECGDCGEYLESQIAAGERYDIIVLDPPKLARTRSGLERAAKAYVRLNRLAMEALNPDGILITCSCSGHLNREDFEQIIARAALDSGRRVQILEQRGQAVDHPVSVHCVETSYLKCFVCRVA
ncbi:class I SAM-dependent rRNA methyltransferase [Planctomicrobium piriforme]|uniref:23S rRNA (Cytosine1962-C5)-methyltransferase n=1 Tax=Planctomicrobium piriforme TaxID=1576369 RepID=A0A1I3RK96_9PLAN|nr:class I SAM-dependent rRNA methyltransferase [Planctomicrobium piriforme]SFJ47023.1 23S rRNA (cytosine1962-C5)-methyltransferase [Planctomicrobium piriforme]